MFFDVLEKQKLSFEYKFPSTDIFPGLFKIQVQKYAVACSPVATRKPQGPLTFGNQQPCWPPLLAQLATKFFLWISVPVNQSISWFCSVHINYPQLHCSEIFTCMHTFVLDVHSRVLGWTALCSVFILKIAKDDQILVSDLLFPWSLRIRSVNRHISI